MINPKLAKKIHESGIKIVNGGYVPPHKIKLEETDRARFIVPKSFDIGKLLSLVPQEWVIIEFKAFAEEYLVQRGFVNKDVNYKLNWLDDINIESNVHDNKGLRQELSLSNLTKRLLPFSILGDFYHYNHYTVGKNINKIQEIINFFKEGYWGNVRFGQQNGISVEGINLVKHGGNDNILFEFDLQRRANEKLDWEAPQSIIERVDLLKQEGIFYVLPENLTNPKKIKYHLENEKNN
jgi:hypothetical protein